MGLDRPCSEALQLCSIATSSVPRQRRRWVHAYVRLVFERDRTEDMSLALVSILPKLDKETRNKEVSLKHANDEYYRLCCNI